MRIREIRDKNLNELNKMLAKFHETLRLLRFKNSEGQLSDVRSIREIKKDVARIYTVLNEKNNKKYEK
jgi:large subunit ribosomal protein L29